MQTMILDEIGGIESIVIFVAILLLFGGKKVPELMRSLGHSIREFNDAKHNVRSKIEESAYRRDENFKENK